MIICILIGLLYSLIRSSSSSSSAVKYTIEKAKVISQNSESCQVINFLDVSVTLHPDRTIKTDIYYKDTKAHDYLSYDSTHPDHFKDNVPYNLAKRIIAFAKKIHNIG